MYDNDLAMHYAQRGFDAMREGRHADAEYLFNLAIDADPCCARAHNDLSALYNIQGRHWEAVQAAREALIHDPSNSLIMYNLATALMEAGELEQALPHLRQVVSQEPQYSLAVFNLAMCYDMLGRLDEALRWYQQAADLAPSDPDPIYNIAEIYSRMKAYRKAEASCSKALDLYDTQFRNTQFAPWLPPGEPLTQEQVLADIAMKKAAALALMAVIQANLGKLKPALDAIREATQIYPRNASWFVLMAEMCRELGRDVEAREAMARAQALDGVGTAF